MVSETAITWRAKLIPWTTILLESDPFKIWIVVVRWAALTIKPDVRNSSGLIKGYRGKRSTWSRKTPCLADHNHFIISLACRWSSDWSPVICYTVRSECECEARKILRVWPSSCNQEFLDTTYFLKQNTIHHNSVKVSDPMYSTIKCHDLQFTLMYNSSS